MSRAQRKCKTNSRYSVGGKNGTRSSLYGWNFETNDFFSVVTVAQMRNVMKMYAQKLLFLNYVLCSIAEKDEKKIVENAIFLFFIVCLSAWFFHLIAIFFYYTEDVNVFYFRKATESWPNCLWRHAKFPQFSIIIPAAREKVETFFICDNVKIIEMVSCVWVRAK